MVHDQMNRPLTRFRSRRGLMRIFTHGKVLTAVALVALVAAPAFAHVTVAPQQSKAGATQVYKVRVHNDGKVPTASIALHVPAGVTISSVEPVATAKSDMTRTGDQVSLITWQVEVPVNKYVELAFTAKNPATGSQLNWNVTEKFKDGTTVEFTDKPGAEEKSSVTKLTSASAAPASAKPAAPAKPTAAKPAAPAKK
jgi:uncharacterized protein YcnI